MSVSERNEWIDKRARYLIDNQPHDHEWEDPYEEVEYFAWRTIFDTIYDEKKDDFFPNPLRLISDESLKETLLKLKGTLLNENVSEIELDTLGQNVFDVLLEDSKMYLEEDYEHEMTEVGLSEVFGLGMVHLVENYNRIDYVETEYFYNHWWCKVDSQDGLPSNKDSGYVVVKTLKDGVYEDDFVYWDGNSFHSENVYVWREIIESDLDLYLSVLERKSEDGHFNRAKALKEFVMVTMDSYTETY